MAAQGSQQVSAGVVSIYPAAVGEASESGPQAKARAPMREIEEGEPEKAAGYATAPGSHARPV